MITYFEQPQSNVAPFLAARIAPHLEKGDRVLLLLSGGSGVPISITLCNLLKPLDLSNLFVTVSDERYGPINHRDENARQLIEAGLFLPKATWFRPLTGKTLDETTSDYAAWLANVRSHADYAIALLGIGEDGHTSGIKPHSPAVTATEAAVSYTGTDYERITTTLPFLETFDEAVVQAYGSSKHSVVRQLLKGEGTTHETPMLGIQSIPTVTIFSDYKENT